MPDDILIRNINRRRTTLNRYVTDSNSYWREELHPRIENLQPILSNYCEDMVRDRIQTNIWGFPVDEQSVANAEDVFIAIIDDYFEFVKGRRTWAYTETQGYWTEAKITNTIAYAFIMALWDIGRNMLITNYPLVEDDLRLRYGKTHSDDERQTYHDSLNHVQTNDERDTQHESKSKLNTGDERLTDHDNTRNKIHEATDSAGSSTANSRSTNNTTTVVDVFLSPQNQGVTPSSQSANVMNHGGGFERPENHGVAEVTPNGNPGFTTNTSNTFEGSTDTNAEGTTVTNREGHSRVDERDYVRGRGTTTSETEGQNNVTANAKNASEKGAENNVGAKARNETGHERQETLDIADVLQNFYNLFKDHLMLAIDNRMLPYFLNMKISRFTDHRIDRKEYI